MDSGSPDRESALFLISFPSRRLCVSVCVLLTDTDCMCGVEDEPRPTDTAIAPPGVHTDPVLTQPRLEALIHIYTHTLKTHTLTHTALLCCSSSCKRLFKSFLRPSRCGGKMFRTEAANTQLYKSEDFSVCV